MPRIPLKAGSFAYQKYKADGTLDDTIITTGLTLQSVELPNVNITTQDIIDGNSLWPLGVVETEATSQVTVTFSDYSPKLLADMLGSEYDSAASIKGMTIESPYSIPEDSPYTITLPESPVGTPAIVVTDIHASPFTQVSSSVTTGKFSVSSSAITFASEDAGSEILVTYAWEDNGEIYGMEADINIPTVRLIITDENIPSNQTGSGYDVTTYIDKARISGDVQQMTQQKTPGTWAWTWRILKPRSGKKAWHAEARKRG